MDPDPRLERYLAIEIVLHKDTSGTILHTV
jgi:hypothetical protein